MPPVINWEGQVKVGRKVIYSIKPIYGLSPTQALAELLKSFFNATEEGYISPKSIIGWLIHQKGVTNELNLKFVVKPL